MKYQHGPCLICGKADASKTNSHLVPSFLEAMYSSYDNSGKRGSELLFSFDNTGPSIYVGKIPDTKYEEIFEKHSLDDENRMKGLRIDTNSIDYVFCNFCEDSLGKILEAPYSNSVKEKKSIYGLTAYFFWLSVIWRMNACRLDFGFHLDDTISSSLHDLLAQYLENSDQNYYSYKQLSEIFCYKLLYCPEFCKNTQEGVQFCHYNENILTFVIADFILIGYFDNVTDLPSDYMFECLRIAINEASINDGANDIEHKYEIATDVMRAVINTYYQLGSKILVITEVEEIIERWKYLQIPIPLSPQIIYLVIQEVHSKHLKLAERGTSETIDLSIKSVLKGFGYDIL